MGIVDLSVEFGDAREAYLPGEAIAGRVRLVVGGDGLKMKSRNVVAKLCFHLPICILPGVTLHLVGQAAVSWTETEAKPSPSSSDGGNSGDNVKQLRGEETYVRQTIELTLHDQGRFGRLGQTAFVVPRGAHDYNFAFRLPDRLPGSIEEEFGWVGNLIGRILMRHNAFLLVQVRYYVEAVVDRQEGTPASDGDRTRKFFNIRDVMDISADQGAMVRMIRALATCVS